MRTKFIVRVLLILVADFCNGSPAERRGAGAELAVTASAAGGAALSAALAQLAALVLRAEGLRARAAPPPAACAALAADARACRDAVFARLVRGELHVALLAAPAARAPGAAWRLRDAGLDELGDAAPPARRECAAPPPARSLLDLRDAALARRYHVPPERLRPRAANDSSFGQNSSAAFVPEWCAPDAAQCATVLVGDDAELRVLERVVRAHRLRAAVRRADAAPDAPLLACGWAPLPARASAAPLGPPPCDLDADDDECPFESRRLVKLVNARELARSNDAVRALARLRLSAAELRALAAAARARGPEAAAALHLAAHPGRRRARELRAAVLLPNATRREAYDAPALAAAAALAEADLEAGPRALRFKVETFDDHCDASRAYRYLNEALNAREYEALSALFGPACGAAWADVARTAPGPLHSLPAVAYTAQAPPAAALALLAGGDARAAAAALGALFARLGWRRAAALSEPATRAALAAARLGADLVANVELPDDESDLDPEIFTQWAARAALANARVLYVCVEDARRLRAALCAGRAAGLTPAAGAVWLLPGALPAHALRPARGERCDAAQLAEVLDGHLSLAPEWALPWLADVEEVPQITEDSTTAAPDSDSDSEERRRWVERWRTQCRLLGLSCSAPGPHAALLYDALRLWAAALAAPLAEHPAALADLHDAALVRSLVTNATRSDFKGITGRFSWAAVAAADGAGAAFARAAPLLLLQWQAGARRRVGRFDGRLRLERALRWRTADGRAPDDGAERCALQPLADLLHGGCRAAFAALGAALLALGGAALAATALCCRRRAERAYRARLDALGLRALLPDAAGAARWELPRERVVINRKLGTGAFGAVYGGHALLGDDRGWTAVAVKTLKAGASTAEKLDFLSEAEAMKRFEHRNVVRLLGVVTRSSPVCTVMEFMLHGDLKGYLLARRHLAGARDAEEQVSARRLTGMALDAARALSYLAQLRYVHRDVAARNCLVGARRQVKLADFGMTRPVLESDYYRFSRKGMLPVRWMAPESLALGVFSPASDVWSFGVLLYEIVTFGALPFRGLANAEVLARVKAGRALALPPGLKPQLEGLIKSCWKADPKARPSACEVAAFLADWPRLLAPCLDAPLDALPLGELPDERDGPADAPDGPGWRARRGSWAAPASQATDATDTTYLSAEPPPSDADRFLP